MIDYEAVLLKMYTEPTAMNMLLRYGLRQENVVCLSEEAGEIFLQAKDWYRRNGEPIPEKALIEDHERYFRTNQDRGEEDNFDPKWIVEKLKTRYLFTEFRRLSAEANKQGVFDADLKFDEAVERSKEFTNQLMEITIKSTNEEVVVPMSEKLPQFIRDTLAFDIDKSGMVSLGFDEVDGMYQGLRKGELAIIAAYLKVGKTHLLCKAALKAAQDGKRVFMAALEPSEDSVYSILTALVGRFPMSHVEEKTMPPNERERFKELVGQEVFDRLFVKHPKNVSSRSLEELYWQARDAGADLVVGDQFSHVNFEGRRQDADWLVESKKAHHARDLSDEIGCASIWAHQLNRDAEKKSSPTSGNIGRSIGIAQAADFMFYLAKVDGSDELRTLACREPRRGPVANWELQFGFDPMMIEVNRQIAT